MRLIAAILILCGLSWGQTSISTINNESMATARTKINNNFTSLNTYKFELSTYNDVLRITAPSNPASGYLRIFANSSTGKLACLDSSGSDCMPTGGVGSPAGSGTELQYRNAGSFGAVAGSSWDGTNIGLSNPTAATNSVGQVSPGTRWCNSAWDATDSTARTICWTMKASSLRAPHTNTGDTYAMMPQFEISYDVDGGTAVPLLHMYHDPTGTPGSDSTMPNLFFGFGAGNKTMTGQAFANMGLGYETLHSLTTGDENTAVGAYRTLYYNTTGVWNSAFGIEAMYTNTTGNSNSAFGQNAGRSDIQSHGNTTGSYNSWFGVSAAPCSSIQRSYTTVLGYSACADQDSVGVLGASGIKWSVGGVPKADNTLDVADASSLGSETLAEGAFSTHAKWTAYGDFNSSFTGSVATYTHSGGWGDIIQASADWTATVVGNKWYAFTYTVTNRTGDVNCRVANTFATSNLEIPLVSTGYPYTHTLYIKTKGAPTEFDISCSSNSGTLVLDDLSLKVVQGGDIQSNGSLKGGSWSVASAATTTLPAGNLFHITGTTSITTLNTCDATQAGRQVMLIFDGALTFTDGNNLKLASSMTTTADDTITLVCDGSNWYETARSVN